MLAHRGVDGAQPVHTPDRSIASSRDRHSLGFGTVLFATLVAAAACACTSALLSALLLLMSGGRFGKWQI